MKDFCLSDGYSKFLRWAYVVSLIFGIVLLTVGPNSVYVLCVLSELPFAAKRAAALSLVAVKLALNAAAVPWTARRAAEVLEPGHGRVGARKRFNLRLLASTLLSAFSLVVAPTAVVLFTDDRCWHRGWQPPLPVENQVSVQLCSIHDRFGACANTQVYTTTSLFTPRFVYSGERCASALFAIYAPVYLIAIPAAAALPAALELLLLPYFLSWYRRTFSDVVIDGHAEAASQVLSTERSDESGSTSTSASASMSVFTSQKGFMYRCMHVLHSITINAASEFKELECGMLSHGLSSELRQDVKDQLNGRLARRATERGLAMLFATFLVAITFGLGAPVVGAACGISAVMHLMLHLHLLCRAVELGSVSKESIKDPGRPALWNCYAVPRRCTLVLVITALLFWTNGTFGYLHILGVVGGALVAFAFSALLFLLLRLWVSSRVRQRSIPWRTLGDVILEPLIGGSAVE